jgi:hypothetical protein
MKRSIAIWGMAVGLAFGFGSLVQAGTPKITIAVSPKKQAGEEKTKGNVTHKETLFQYTVKLTNSFTPASGLTAEYRIFVRSDSGKGAMSQQKLKRQEGSSSVPDLPGMGTFSFDTDPAKLESATLDGNFYYINGTRNRSADKVAGIWVRVLQGDKVVGEYINPSTLAKEQF